MGQGLSGAIDTLTCVCGTFVLRWIMAQYDGSIRINTAINTQGFDRGMNHLRDGMISIGKSMGGIIKALGFGIGIAGLVSLGKQAIETASDIQEVQNVVDTAFGSMSYKMEQFADTAVKQFGISKLSAKEIGSTFMAMGQSMIGSMEAASDMAINLTARAADMSSFYNKSIEETSTALKSIYTGETESLKEYGVVMTQVNLQEFARQRGITKSIQAMTQAEKVELQYAYVMKQTSLAAGDFAKTSDSWANQTRILSEQFKELLSVIGSGLITVFTPVIKFLNTVLSLLITIAKQIGAVLSALFGISIPTSDSSKFAQDMDDAAGGADDFADGIKKAGKEADKTKGKLASFDKLEVLKKDSGGSGGGAAGAGGAGDMFSDIAMTPGMEKTEDWLDSIKEKMNPILDYLEKLKNIFFQGFWDGLGDWEYRWDSIKESLSSIKSSIIDIFTDPQVLSAADGWVQSVVYLIGSIVGSLASIGLTIAANVLGGISKYLEENKGRIKDFLVSIFNIKAEINYLLADFFQSFAYVFEAFASEDGQRLTANLIGIFANAFMGASELVSKLARDILNIFIQPFVENKEVFKTALEGFLGVLADVAGTIKQGINDTFDKLNEVYDEHFKPFFDSIAEGLAEIVSHFLDFWNGTVQPILENWSKNFDGLWKGHIQPFINNFIDLLGSLVDILKVLWKNILVPLINWFIDNFGPEIASSIDGAGEIFAEFLGIVTDIAGGIIDGIKNIVDFLTNVFQGDWESAWENIIDFIKGPLITDTTEAGGNLVRGIIEGIEGMWESLKETVIESSKIVIERILSVWEEIKENAYEKWEEIKTTVSGKAKEIIESVSQWFSELPEKIGYAFGYTVVKITEWVEQVKGYITTEIPLIIESAVTFFSELPQKIYDAIIGFLDKIREWKDNSVSEFKTNIPLIINEIVTKFQELPGKLIEIGKNAIDGLWNGIKEAASGLKDKISEFCSGFVGGFKDALGVHSPSTLFAEIGGFLIEGLANGISSAIDLVTSVIGGLVDGILGMFSFDKWSEAGQGMIESIVSVIETFRETWDESFAEWMELNQELYFGYDVWYEQFANILLAYTTMFAEFSAQWQADMNLWWTTMVMPFFELVKWQAFGTQMKTGIINGLKTIVNEIGGLLNKIIGMFNSAFKELERAMNDLIEDYNESAKQLGRSTLSKVRYSPMAGIKVPALASGAVIRGGNPFLAILGDQRYGQTNIEAPLSTIKQAVREEMMNLGYGGSNAGSVPVNVNLYYNGEVFARLSIPDILSELNRQGYDITALMGNG